MFRITLLVAFVVALPAFADEATDKLAKELRDYATAELAKVPGKDGKFSTALPDYLRDQIKLANQRDREAWNKVKTRADWEKFRDERIKALRDSLGTWPEVPKNMAIRVTRTIEAADYRIDNLLYESRPGVWVTGNLYYPAKPPAKMPVFLIVHSHHAPKHQGELQDMGVLWAKLGCMVLVIDQLGHGERRQHPFHTAKDYPKEFRVGRQDYYFRYNLNLQLSLVGDSLMGWMAWDLMRGLDVVLARPGADKDRVILLGAVAGGGDPAAVTAALDSRFTCVVPFNFGGPQPEHRYPLPEDAETSFNYAGSGSWESTRNLRDSAAKGFLPWVIVASVGPRKLIHAHEFSWDRDRDPVWKRYQKVFGFYDATDNLSFTHGGGVIHNNDPNGTHCTNIGAIHRKGIYAALQKWYDIPPPAKEPNERRSAEELRCWTPEALAELKPKPLHEVLGGMADEQLKKPHTRGEVKSRTILSAFGKTVDERIGSSEDWPPQRIPVSCDAAFREFRFGGLHRYLVLKPQDMRDGEEIPCIQVLAHEGTDRFIEAHAEAVARLVRANSAVVLLDWKWTGAGRPGDGRGRASYSSSLASSSLMIGKPLATEWAEMIHWVFCQRVRRSGFVDPSRVVIWGDSLAGVNSAEANVAPPHDLSQPKLSEPLAATFASIMALDVKPKAIIARGGLVSYRSVLDSPFVHVPHDALPINVFRAGDLPDVWAALAPKPLRLEGLVDGTNRRVTGERLEKALKPVTEAYKKGTLVVKEQYSSDEELAKWIIEQLKK
jgi:hypothetical protein